MNDNARKWVEALRSGEFEQAKGVLYDGTGYCCLGVACKLYADVHNMDGFTQPLFEDEYGDEYVDMSRWWFLQAGELLPYEVRNWLGLRYENALYQIDEMERDDLASRNDAGDTFNEIADIIESEPVGLFA